jgi:DNA-binding LacI/PurR family transcriptional regulator
VLDDLSRQGITERRVGKGTFLKAVPGQARRSAQAVVMLTAMSHADASRDVYFGRIISSLEESFNTAGQRFLLMSGRWGRYPSEELNDIRNANPSAIVFSYSLPSDKPFIAQLTTLGIPLVLLHNPLPGALATQIHFDDYGGGVLAAEYLLERGHRRFGVIAAPEGSPAGEERVEAFIHTLRRYPGAELAAVVRTGNYDQLWGYEQAKELLSQTDARLDAIFCAGDLIAHGAIQQLKKQGLRVPEDIAVMGYGGFSGPWNTQRKLTSVHMDLEAMGRRAAEAILSLRPGQQGPLQEENIRLPVDLIAGDTA